MNDKNQKIDHSKKEHRSDEVTMNRSRNTSGSTKNTTKSKPGNDRNSSTSKNGMKGDMKDWK